MKFFYLLFVFVGLIKGQNYGTFLKEFKKAYNVKTESFFIIQCKTNLELYTNAPALIKRFRELRNNQICPYVYFICYDGAGVGDDIIPFFKKNFYVDTNQFVKVFVNKKLYDLLVDVNNSRIIYFKNNKVNQVLDGKYKMSGKPCISTYCTLKTNVNIHGTKKMVLIL